MLTAELVQKHSRLESAPPPDSRHWFPTYDSHKAFQSRLEERHWTVRCVNETWNILTRDVLEIIGLEDIMNVRGIYLVLGDDAVFTGFRNTNTELAAKTESVLIVNLQAIQDELGQRKEQSASNIQWCTIS